MIDLESLAAFERWFGSPLAPGLRTFLAEHAGHATHTCSLYAVSELEERNQTYETRTYCPGFVTIGDDGGGRAIVVHHTLNPATVWLVDHGSMNEADFVAVGESPAAWRESGCPLEPRDASR